MKNKLLAHNGKPSLVQVSRVPLELVDPIWMNQRHAIERGLTHGQRDATTSNEMLAAIKSGRMSLLVVYAGRTVLAITVISVQRTPTMTKLVVELLAGRKMRCWADALQGTLRAIGRGVGADRIEASCRFGLAKYLGQLGWTKKAVIMDLRCD